MLPTFCAFIIGFVVPFAEGLYLSFCKFTTMPSEEWKNMVGSALTAYAADQTDDNWAVVVKNFVDGWAAEYALLG